MSGIDFTVWPALVLSLASAILCVVYGLIRWNADDDPADTSSAGDVREGPEATPPERNGA